MIHLRGGTVIALDCVSTTKDYVQGRPLVTGKVTPPKNLLADPNVPLKTLVSA